MYCRSCGTQLGPNDTFCANCGAKVSAPPPPAPPLTASERERARMQAQETVRAASDEVTSMMAQGIIILVSGAFWWLIMVGAVILAGVEVTRTLAWIVLALAVVLGFATGMKIVGRANAQTR